MRLDVIDDSCRGIASPAPRVHLQEGGALVLPAGVIAALAGARPVEVMARLPLAIGEKDVLAALAGLDDLAAATETRGASGHS